MIITDQPFSAPGRDPKPVLAVPDDRPDTAVIQQLQQIVTLQF